jgi:L-type amino acid transporter 9
MLGNSFVAGRMTVAAANKGWFPSLLGTVGQVGSFRVSKSNEAGSNAGEAMDRGESPMYVQFMFTTERQDD